MTREEIIQDYKDTLEERRDIHLTAYQLDHLIDWVEIIAIQVQAPVILQGELLPCPFCGNEAELIEKGNNFTKKRFVTIKCTNKNCRAEMTNGAIRNDMNWLKEISTNAWNKRAGREPQSK